MTTVLKNIELEWIKQFIVSPSLEVGCGSNRLPGVDVAVDKTEPGTFGTEGSQYMHFCKADYQAMMDDLPFGDNSFASVLSRHVIEHHPDPAAVLTEWFRVLAPGGVVAIITPDLDAYEDAETVLALDPTHEHVFSRDQLAEIASTVGFLDITTETVESGSTFGLRAYKPSTSTDEAQQ